VPPQQLEQISLRNAGVSKGESAEGIELYYSYARSPVSGWTASVGAERGELDRAVRAGWVVGGTLMVVGVLAGLSLALSLAGRLRRAIVSLAGAAAATSRRTRPACARARSSSSSTRCSKAAQAREARARRAQAEAESETKDRYIATLSHELRNPLAALNNAVYLLGMEGRKEIAPTLEMMQRQIAQLTRMVNDLLDVSRETHGKIALQLAPTDLAGGARAGDRDRRAGVAGEAPHPHARARARPAHGARRRGAPAAGVLEPPRQRRQVHADRRRR
jgi:signal transduction histidine kinase